MRSLGWTVLHPPGTIPKEIVGKPVSGYKNRASMRIYQSEEVARFYGMGEPAEVFLLSDRDQCRLEDDS